MVSQLKEAKRKDLVAMQNKIMQVGVSWVWLGFDWGVRGGDAR